ncbi:hypothetical protein JCM33774_49680 [Actinophytocola sp. KF-1]
MLWVPLRGASPMGSSPKGDLAGVVSSPEGRPHRRGVLTGGASSPEGVLPDGPPRRRGWSPGWWGSVWGWVGKDWCPWLPAIPPTSHGLSHRVKGARAVLGRGWFGQPGPLDPA